MLIQITEIPIIDQLESQVSWKMKSFCFRWKGNSDNRNYNVLMTSGVVRVYCINLNIPNLLMCKTLDEWEVWFSLPGSLLLPTCRMKYNILLKQGFLKLLQVSLPSENVSCSVPHWIYLLPFAFLHLSYATSWWKLGCTPSQGHSVQFAWWDQLL